MKYIKYLLLFIFSYSIFALTTEEENLFNAINEKDSQEVSSLISSADTNININVLDTNGYTPIHRAVYNNDLATVNELLKNTNLNINSKLDMTVSIDGWYLGGATPLILASYLGYTNIVKTLLDNNADIKARDDIDGTMAIHMAAANGNNEVIEILLSKDETIINETDNKGNNPLHWAAMKDKPETIKFLSERGADIEAKDVDGWTPLHYASAFSSLQTVENLIDLGADKESKANDGSTPLSYAQRDDIKNYLSGGENIERENEENIINDNNEEDKTQAELLEERKEDNIENTANEDNANENNEDNEISATENIEDNNKDELDVRQLELLVAIKNNDIIAVNNLIKDGVNPNFQDEDGFSPLHRAIENNNLDLVNALLSYEDIDKEIKLPYEATTSEDWYLGGDTPLLYASYIGNPQIVSALLEANCNIRARDDIDGAMAIHIAAANGNNEVINLLLNKDKTLINEADNNGADTPLHWAIMKNYDSTIELLLSQGASPTQANSSSQTPLHYAAMYGNMNAVVLLVEKYNVDKNWQDADGLTAADWAKENEYNEIVAYLGGSTTQVYENNNDYDLPIYKKKRDLSKKWWNFNY
ncbi:ankyrin repeat domain-containing protein [Brachyspira catarrhinii]|uniref:Ankyrin repeat domain-containing protein n=1 Tax=Brachyspira catarrhinii TaxID=2528966 RepID=A0ABY2TP95_9SPIR|nr:ankyrin repeat domain-containing protein [Brachyspira catarrhinii]TKZ32041.1 ankyrin repeat domain-containing protein [Brachyspira catarrhinii]